MSEDFATAIPTPHNKKELVEKGIMCSVCEVKFSEMVEHKVVSEKVHQYKKLENGKPKTFDVFSVY